MFNNVKRSNEILLTTRENIQKIMDSFSLEQLNHIPPGFNNNLIWNYGHVIVTQQLLVYQLSKMDMLIAPELVNKYRKGTKPEQSVSQAEYNILQDLMHSLPKRTINNYEAGLFKDYTTYTTSYGVTISNVEEAIYFNNIHEGMHLGVMLSIRKFVSQDQTA